MCHRNRQQTVEALGWLFGTFLPEFFPTGRFGVGIFCPSSHSPEHQMMEAAGTMWPCHLSAGACCPLQCCVIPQSPQHSPPEELLLHGSGLGSSISSELCCAQQILGFLFHQSVVMSTFAWASGEGFGPAASSPGCCSRIAQGFTQHAGTMGANRDTHLCQHPSAAKIGLGVS